ncbi:response regulator [Leptolyngbya sp. BC1307]|uniref:hybrid sensor histidine kinase/response regulator n=1 Tax=Leptolyngbya sp. BC1307 TaxID=2029589 RepID=UPI000EFA41E4|nr:response regulator [Leptolyngbya sp. BC1307]
MADTEQEIRLQFLDEAEEYLDTLETTLLGVAQRGVDSQGINAALRAAHSIKGGSALMGYDLTSSLAHRLEDSLKVLRVKRGEGVNPEVESQLLRGVDAIRQIVERDRTGTLPTEDWLSTAVLPIFDRLYNLLGEPTAEDDALIMDADEGQNVMPLIFQTEIEGSLAHLEQLIDQQADHLGEALIKMSQELSGLGKMLDLPTFVQLCQSIERAAAGPAPVQTVAQKTLQAWRRCQALVLTGNADAMPTQLAGVSFEPVENPVEMADQLLETADWADLGAEDDQLVGDVFAGLIDEDDATVSDRIGDVFVGAEAAAVNPDLLEPDAVETGIAQPNADADAFTTGFAQVTAAVDRSHNSDGQADAADYPLGNLAGTEFRFSETPQSQAPDLADNTVRVSVRQLNALNDDFGELTIERNRLESEVERLRNLVKDLSRKLRSLNAISDDVKDLYEQPHPPLLLSGTKILSGTKTAALPASSFRNNFDTLELDRYSDDHLPFRQIVESVVKLQETADDIELSVDRTEQTTRTLHRTARHLQRNLNQLRMRPLSDITNRFPRALRELAAEHHKPVELQLEGENTLVDRNILEALSDPLMHLVRNAFDHGIETPQQRQAQGKPRQGTISIRAFNRSGRTVITVSDDGGGIALEKIRDRAQTIGLDAELLRTATEADLLSLIFEPGFSTSSQVTALSGRGVGMDVVRNNLTEIRGDISVETKAGKGTTFTISVPYTLSITRVMLAEGNRMPVALPTDMIEAVVVVNPVDIYRVDGREMFSYRGSGLRLIRLANWLAFNCPRQIDSLEETPNLSTPSVLIFRMGDQRLGLQVDRSWREQEVAVRRVEGPIALPAGFSNCTILGDGKVVPLVNLPDLARWVLSCEGTDINTAEALYSNPVVNGLFDPFVLQPAAGRAAHHPPRFLVIDDSANVRRLLALTLEKAGYEVAQARDGQDAIEKLETGLIIDSIVCDIEMPRMDGYSFLSKLRALPQYADVPVTMLTSRSGEKHRALAMDLGATAYFSKPYQERSLLKSLAASLKR